MSRWRRVRSLTLGEIGCRARQRVSGWWDELSPAFEPDGAPRRMGDRDARVPAHAREAAAVRFFAGAGEDAAQQRESARGEWLSDLRARADAILDGAFDLLGHRGLRFGDPIDWHLDPISGRRAPMIHWRRIDALDFTVVGDSKVIWELNRHQWMVTLAQAYRLTGDERFAEGALARLDDWSAANPYPLGINWSSSLEAALRIVAWSWTMVLIRESPALTSDRLARWQTLMRAHARHVERYLSQYYSPNTHLTGEALGLVYAGVVLAGSADAARWRDTGRRVLVAELDRQVRSDGVHFEQATCYQRYTADIYLHLLLLARRNHLHLPDHVEPAIARTVRALLLLAQPDGSVPNIGDADGGWLLPLAPRAPRDCRGTFGVAAVVFDDDELAWAAGECPVEVDWLCGADGRRAFARLGRRPPAIASTLLGAGGYAIMRTGWHTDAHQAIVDVGPLGCPVSGAHGHADLLSLQCVAFGEVFLVDPGTYCYTADARWREHFRSSTAHSTLVVDAQSQARPAGPFSWRGRPNATLHAWVSTATHDIVDGSHDGYRRGSRGVRHRRRVVFLKPTAWIVIDEIIGDGAHDLELRYQFAPRAVTLEAGGWVRAEGTRGRGLWLQVTAPEPIALGLREGARDPIDGWVSPAYGVRVPAPVVIASGRCDGGTQIVTAIVPECPIASAPPAIEWIYEPSGRAVGVRIGGDDRLIRFDATSVSITSVAQPRSA
jgi:hypothetical protein